MLSLDSVNSGATETLGPMLLSPCKTPLAVHFVRAASPQLGHSSMPSRSEFSFAGPGALLAIVQKVANASVLQLGESGVSPLHFCGLAQRG